MKILNGNYKDYYNYEPTTVEQFKKNIVLKSKILIPLSKLFLIGLIICFHCLLCFWFNSSFNPKTFVFLGVFMGCIYYYFYKYFSVAITYYIFIKLVSNFFNGNSSLIQCFLDDESLKQGTSFNTLELLYEPLVESQKVQISELLIELSSEKNLTFTQKKLYEKLLDVKNLRKGEILCVDYYALGFYDTDLYKKYRPFHFISYRQNPWES